MLFKLNIHLTENDYKAFNHFHSLESAQGKKAIRNGRIFFSVIMACLALLVFLPEGVTAFSLTYATLLLLGTVIYVAVFKKMVIRNLNSQIKKLKKTGKLPYDPVSNFEFHQDHMVEIAESSRTEQGYSCIERVCVLHDRYLLLYKNSVGAYILPMEQVKAQVDPDAFLAFLAQKCTNIQHY